MDDLERDLVLTGNRDESHGRQILEALGRGKLNLFNYLPALYYFSRCLDRYPDDVRALAGRGLTLERMMNKDRAKRDYRRRWNCRTGAPTCVFAWRPFAWTTPKSRRPNLNWNSYARRIRTNRTFKRPGRGASTCRVKRRKADGCWTPCWPYVPTTLKPCICAVNWP